MKVSIVHPERRCAQHLALDLVTPAAWSQLVRDSDALPAGFPTKLMPTQRFDFTLAPGALLSFVASAAIKARADAIKVGDFNGLLGPLVIELEAEEGEQLTDDLVRIFRLGEGEGAAALASVGPAAHVHLTDPAVVDQLIKVPAPITRAGDRQQYGMLTILVHPKRDLLIAMANPAAASPATCTVRL